jgi:hypothetical protein
MSGFIASLFDSDFAFVTFAVVPTVYTESTHIKIPSVCFTETIDFFGADGRNRTADLLITNQLLCRLSYVGSVRQIEDLHERKQWASRGWWLF